MTIEFKLKQLIKLALVSNEQTSLCDNEIITAAESLCGKK